MSTFQGRIRYEFLVTCGNCGDDLHLTSGTYKECQSELRKATWMETKKHGWLCPNCVGDHITMRKYRGLFTSAAPAGRDAEGGDDHA